MKRILESVDLLTVLQLWTFPACLGVACYEFAVQECLRYLARCF